jgi:esterase
MSDTPSPLLHHEFLAADGASPTRWLYMLHGIFGSGRNWGSVARRLVRARPEWGVVLVDLREHGASEGFPPPHTVDACAADLVALARSTGRPVDALLGHSFGGKVALAFVDGGGTPAQLWVVDSTPDTGRAGGTAWQMLERVKGLPDHFGSRDELVDRLAEVGISQPVARWMATNLQGDPTQGYRWRFNLAAIEELLLDFFTRDLWNVLESPPHGTEIHLIRALQSSVLSGSAIGRIQGMEGKGTVFLHPVEGGHWVNADNPDALHDLLTAGLPVG